MLTIFLTKKYLGVHVQMRIKTQLVFGLFKSSMPKLNYSCTAQNDFYHLQIPICCGVYLNKFSSEGISMEGLIYALFCALLTAVHQIVSRLVGPYCKSVCYMHYA